MTKPGLVNKIGQGSAVNMPAATETVLATVQVSTDNPGATVVLEGNVDISTGLSTTAVQLRVYRGGIGGVIVGESEPPAEGASVRVVVPIQVIDQPGEVASQVYTLTALATSSTGASTCNFASLQATY